MTWSLDESLPTAKDRVRVLVGDTDATDPLISDEGIAVFLSGGALEQTSERLAAAEVATAIAAKFARRPLGMRAGGTEVNWGVMVNRYTDLAKQLREADAASESMDGLFDWAEMVIEPFGARERLDAELLRSGL
ncbi:MAG: hypothetical protein IT337_09365 [Thermomicrobiales bacterium]|nr:hypothetical protein [Thermomicrobiales bacterium]